MAERTESQVRAENLDLLAAKLGRPATGMSAFKLLTPDKIVLLSDAIDDACGRRRGLLADALDAALPGPSGRILLTLLRARQE
jgi:hypothetical protein